MVDQITIEAFGDELAKIAGLKDWWSSLKDIFRSDDAKVTSRVDYQFSPKAGKDKWTKFERNVRDPKFVERVISHPMADSKLKKHVKSMHQLSRGTTVAKIQSTRLPGKSYEVRKVPGGLACTCPDWRYKGTVTPGHKCKHIKAFEAGKTRA